MDPAPPTTTTTYTHSFFPPPYNPPREITANTSHPFSRALAQYPFLTSLAKHLDHTDLDSISRCCHQFHYTLAPYRRSLLPQSLSCERPTLGISSSSAPSRQPCARDLVKGCMRCGTAVCRNCVARHVGHDSRLRRLCVVCQRAPQEKGTVWCECASMVWLCELCSRIHLADAERYRERCEMFITEYVGGRMGLRGGVRKGAVGCALGGARCKGIMDAVHDEEPDMLIMGEEWELEEALEELGEVQLVGLKGEGLKEGKEVSWGGRVDLQREWSGEVRAWCRWCEQLVMSKADRERARTQG